MAFNDIAIDDGCMAGLEFNGNMVLSLDRRDFTGVFRLDVQAALFQMFDPVAAASSAR
jgi:hypothetical protein